MLTSQLSNNKWISLLAIFAIFGLGAFSMPSTIQTVEADAIKVGLITDSPVLMDGGFNQMANSGLLRAESELGVEGTVYLSADYDAIVDNLEECRLDGNALCVTIGFGGADATYDAAVAHPATYYAAVDISLPGYPQNLQWIIFASEQPAYLAGVLAGKMTESDILGIIGGMEIPSVTAFIDGFIQGATCANPKITPLLIYTGSFTEPDLGTAAAESLLAQEADVIFAVAGLTGNGALLTTTQAGAWAIGVDTDQYLTVFEGGSVPGAEYMLTSAMKRVDNAVFQVISEVVSGNFTYGTVTYDLAVNGVDIAPYHEADSSIPLAAKAAVAAARRGLLDGTINPYTSCPIYSTIYNLSLPYSRK